MSSAPLENSKPPERPTPSPASRLRLAVGSFHRTIEGIRDLLTIVSPHLPARNAAFLSAIEGLPRRQRRAGALYGYWMLRRALGADFESKPKEETADTDNAQASQELREGTNAQAESGDSLDGDDRASSAIDEADDPPLTDEENAEWTRIRAAARAGELSETEIRSVVEGAFADNPGAFVEIATAFSGMINDPDKRRLLNTSMLVTAVAAFETLLARILSVQFELFPGLLDSSERQFSLAELEAFSSIEDARRAAIHDRVDGLMRQRFEDWEKWFANQAKIDLASHCIDRDTLYEVIQRRHLLVHTGGVVSPQYRKRVGESAAELESTLSAGPDYLERALDELDAAGIALGLVAAGIWAPDEAERTVGELLDLAYGLLRLERYNAVASLCDSAPAIGKLPSRDGLILRVNGWLARKGSDGTDSIREEVEAWDVSALSPEFRIAKFAMLDDLDPVIDALPSLVQQGVISARSVSEWPLFKELRDDERFPELWEEISSVAPDDECRSRGPHVAGSLQQFT